jgi:formylglycine-generating enzyme required for sulfatase activity
MIVIPAGAFTMGSAATEQGRSDNEGPQHKVTIAKPFAVAKFDVTFADWDACVSVGGCPQVTQNR